MLRILRHKKTAKKIWIGLAVIIIPAFALWGFGGSSRDRQETKTTVKISGKAVSALEFKNSLLAVKTYALMQLGDDQFKEYEKYLNLENQARERLILLSEAKTRKIRANDQEVIDEIQNSPSFADKNGFNDKIYQQALRYGLRLQARAFEEMTRQNLILSKLYKQVTQEVNFSDAQIRQEYLKTNEELNIRYIESLPSDLAVKIKPTDKQLAAYFEKNKAMFKLSPAKDVAVRIPELAEVKNKVKDSFIKEESKKMAEDKIKKCAEKLKKSTFAQAAKTSGLRTSQTAFFKSSGQIENLGSAEIFWDEAKKLKDNQLSSIISNEKGFYIIQLGAIKPLDEAKFAKEKQVFSQKLFAVKKNEVFAKFSEELVKKAQ